MYIGKPFTEHNPVYLGLYWYKAEYTHFTVNITMDGMYYKYIYIEE